MKQLITLATLIFSLFVFSACSGDEDGQFMTVTAITNYSTTDKSPLREAKVGQMVRIEGSGLTAVRAIYINGTMCRNINGNYITDKYIIFKIPATIPVGDNLEDKTYENSISLQGIVNTVTFSIKITK